MLTKALAVVTCFIMCVSESDALASTVVYELDLELKSEHVSELQSGWDPSTVCYQTSSCFPTDFRLPTGYFVDLGIGDTSTATFVFEDYSKTLLFSDISGWEVFGSILSIGSMGRPDLKASWYSDSPTGTVVLDLSAQSIVVSSEGPGDYNYSGICDPDVPHPELPEGYCGYFGYTAVFEVQNTRISDAVTGGVSVSAVPVGPAMPFLAAAITFSALVLRRKPKQL